MRAASGIGTDRIEGVLVEVLSIKEFYGAKRPESVRRALRQDIRENALGELAATRRHRLDTGSHWGSSSGGCPSRPRSIRSRQLALRSACCARCSLATASLSIWQRRMHGSCFEPSPAMRGTVSVENMTDIQITEHPGQATAVIREQVPMAELANFFSHAFADIMAALQKQGVQPVGPPFGKYYGRPGAEVDVEAGFPVSGVINPAGNVVPGDLPGGRIVEATHVGPFDTLANTYADVESFFAEHKLKPSEVMWENYLAAPESEQSPEGARTQICWPVD